MDTHYIQGGLVVCTFCIIAHIGGVSYDGYQVLQINITDWEDWTMVEERISNITHEIDVWKRPVDVGDTFVILLEPSDIVCWNKLCTERQLRCSVLIKNVQRLIDGEVKDNSREKHWRYKRDDDNLLYRLADIYPPWDEIELWLRDLEAEEPLITLLDIGKTYENRTLYLIKLTGASDPDKVPAFWIDGGIHAREWIVHTSMIYSIRNLIEGYYDNNTDIRPLVENMLFYIMPVLNPDGYDYSYKEDRFWRKNRSLPPANKRDGYGEKICIGVDLNRNFNISWGTVGVSTNSCSVVYPGHEPMSELEIKAVTKFIMSDADRIFGYLSVHSFGQLVLSRWAYVNDTPPDNEELMELAKETAAAMSSVNDYEFLYGISPRLLYSFSGGAPDWAKAKANIKYSYSFELRDLGVFGFALPKSHIEPAGEELLKGLITIASRVKEYGENVTKTRHQEQTGGDDGDGDYDGDDDDDGGDDGGGGYDGDDDDDGDGDDGDGDYDDDDRDDSDDDGDDGGSYDGDDGGDGYDGGYDGGDGYDGGYDGDDGGGDGDDGGDDGSDGDDDDGGGDDDDGGDGNDKDGDGESDDDNDTKGKYNNDGHDSNNSDDDDDDDDNTNTRKKNFKTETSGNPKLVSVQLSWLYCASYFIVINIWLINI